MLITFGFAINLYAIKIQITPKNDVPILPVINESKSTIKITDGVIRMKDIYLSWLIFHLSFSYALPDEN